MLDKVRLVCAHCGLVSFHSQAYVQGQINAMKIHKRDEVAQQMHDKCGRFYDKWKAAMEKRGPLHRCKTCLGFNPDDPVVFTNDCKYWDKKVNPGQFCCKRYIQFDRG